MTEGGRFQIVLDNLVIIHYFEWLIGPLTQEVEYLPFKQRVVGSSPARPTIKIENSKFGIMEIGMV